MVENKKNPMKYRKIQKAARTMAATIVLGNTILTPLTTLAATNPEEEIVVQEIVVEESEGQQEKGIEEEADNEITVEEESSDISEQNADTQEEVE